MLLICGQPLNIGGIYAKIWDEGRKADRVTNEAEMQPWSAGALFDLRRTGSAPAPVLLSVPHAGRDYAPAILARARVPAHVLRRLEDRHADLLIEDLTARGYPALIARVPRAVIDLNRDARDIDPRLVSGIPRAQPLMRSAKQRGGLGLFPRSLPHCGDLWRGALGWTEARDRMDRAHGPYHAAIGRELDLLCDQHGQALLVDVHSMPPLALHAADRPRPDVVIGDRFGASAPARLAEAACAVVRAHGMVAALNHPYPGSYLLERHGRPARGRHALQIEISRDLYLDEGLESPGPGLVAVRAMLTRLVEELGQDLIRGCWSEAAE